jgi:hypothetical protein
MGMGLAGLGTASGAAQGLQEILAQRLRERQMALQEQNSAQGQGRWEQEFGFRQAESEREAQERAVAQAIQLEILRGNQQNRDYLQADRTADNLAIGDRFGSGAPQINTLERGGLGNLMKAIPMSPDQAMPRMKIGAPDQMGAKPITAEYAPGEYEYQGTGTQRTSRANQIRADERMDMSEREASAREDRFNRSLAAAGERRNTLSPAQKSAEERRLRNEWKSLSANWRTMKGQVATMEAGMDASRKGDRAAGAQAVLVTFQKILDPTSVVRESEYARSAEGQSILNRMKGAVDKATVGGVGVIVPELETFYNLAKQMVRGADLELQGTRKILEDSALDYGINPSRIFVGDNFSPEGRSDTVMGEGLGAGSTTGGPPKNPKVGDTWESPTGLVTYQGKGKGWK